MKLTKNVMNILAVGVAEVESLKSALGKAKKEAEASKVAVDREAKAPRKSRRPAKNTRRGWRK